MMPTDHGEQAPLSVLTRRVFKRLAAHVCYNHLAKHDHAIWEAGADVDGAAEGVRLEDEDGAFGEGRAAIDGRPAGGSSAAGAAGGGVAVGGYWRGDDAGNYRGDARAGDGAQAGRRGDVEERIEEGRL